MDNTHHVLEGQVTEKAYKAEHIEGGARRGSVTQDAFNRRHSVSSSTGGRRNSLAKNFDHANVAMVIPDKTHVEISDDVASDSNAIDNIAVSWFVWIVAATASIAGSLFGYEFVHPQLYGR